MVNSVKERVCVSVEASWYVLVGVPGACSRDCSSLTRFFPAGDDEEGRSTRDEIRLSKSSVRLDREGVGETNWIVSQSLAIKKHDYCLPLPHLNFGGCL